MQKPLPPRTLQECFIEILDNVRCALGSIKQPGAVCPEPVAFDRRPCGGRTSKPSNRMLGASAHRFDPLGERAVHLASGKPGERSRAIALYHGKSPFRSRSPALIPSLLGTRPVSRVFFNNYFYYHQHRGIDTVGPLFSSTSWHASLRTYFLHLFSITSWNIPSFFPPRFFPASPSRIE